MSCGRVLKLFWEVFHLGGPSAPRLDSLGVTDVGAIPSLADELHVCVCVGEG